MSKRIDLTKQELRDKLYDWKTKVYEPQMAIPGDLYDEIEEILFGIEHLGLVAELKTCYEAIDVLSKSTIDDTMTIALLAKKLAKQNRDIEEIIDCLDGVDSIFSEEIIGMLRPLLARV